MGALNNRVAKLEADHKAADEEIQKQQSRPHADALAIQKLKRR